VTYFEDLTPYSFLDHLDPRYRDSGQAAVNVGWLESGHPFPAGQAGDAAITAALRLVRDSPVNPTRGWHRCDLCERRPPGLSPTEMELDGSPVFLGHCEIRKRFGRRPPRASRAS
jgi:hypothetical protein